MTTKRFLSYALGGIFIALGLFFEMPSAHAATNISATTTEHWAWNDMIGWIDWYNPNTVTVTSQRLKGYASSSIGDISLDCETTRIGNICGTSNYYVMNDGLGSLSGWGWNDVYGWISFCGGQGTSDCPGSGISYRTLIDPDTGDFSEYAWNDLVGWISFNCLNSPLVGLCSTSNFKVKTAWRATSTKGYVYSTVFDTGVSGGAQLNSLIWYGSLPTSTAARFQFATSASSSGPWNYLGPNGTSDTYYSGTAGTSIRLDYTLHANKRYFKYQIILVSNKAQTQTPRLDEVIVNWSP